jgi:hypothetical protein
VICWIVWLRQSMRVALGSGGMNRILVQTGWPGFNVRKPKSRATVVGHSCKLTCLYRTTFGAWLR